MKSEWINLENKKPSYDERVLIIDRDGFIQIATLKQKNLASNKKPHFIEIWFNDDRCDREELFPSECPVAWLPLEPLGLLYGISKDT